MLLFPGKLATVEFTVERGELIALSNPTALIYRKGIETTVASAIANPSVGIYCVSFTVPTTWEDFDRVAVRLSGIANGLPIACVKAAGVVLSDSAKLAALYALEGLANSVSARDASIGSPGFRRTSSGIEQIITANNDGSFTIAPTP